MNYASLFLFKSGRMDKQTESDAYEPTVQFAQVGSKIGFHISYQPRYTILFEVDCDIQKVHVSSPLSRVPVEFVQVSSEAPHHSEIQNKSLGSKCPVTIIS